AGFFALWTMPSDHGRIWAERSGRRAPAWTMRGRIGMARQGAMRGCLAVVIATCALAHAQSTTQASVSGNVSGSSSDGTGIQIGFKCSGIPMCVGTFQAQIKDHECSNVLNHSGKVEVSGLDLARNGPIAGTINLYDSIGTINNPDGTCSPQPRSPAKVISGSYSGTWNASAGTMRVTGIDGDGAAFVLDGGFSATVTLPPPVFPMTVTSDITDVQASATAQFQPRPQDVGKQESVFVFALAPSALAKG